MEPTRRKGVHVEVEVVGTLPELDTGMEREYLKDLSNSFLCHAFLREHYRCVVTKQEISNTAKLTVRLLNAVVPKVGQITHRG